MPLPYTIDLLWEDDIISQSLYLRFRWTRDQILFQLDHYEWDNPIGRKWFKMEFMSSVSNLKRWGVDDLASEFKPEHAELFGEAMEDWERYLDDLTQRVLELCTDST